MQRGVKLFFFFKLLSNSEEQREVGSVNLSLVGHPQDLCNELITESLCVFNTTCSVGKHTQAEFHKRCTVGVKFGSKVKSNRLTALLLLGAFLMLEQQCLCIDLLLKEIYSSTA